MNALRSLLKLLSLIRAFVLMRIPQYLWNRFLARALRQVTRRWWA